MIDIPQSCPCCASKLVRVKDQLFCRNAECGETATKRVVNYAKKRKIKGLAEKSIIKVNIKSVAEIYTIGQGLLEAALGKNGTKIHLEIEKSLKTTLSDLIGSLSIPLVGRTTAKKIVGNSLDDLDYSALPPKAKENFVRWRTSTEYIELLNLPFEFIEVIQPVDTIKGSICITGSFKGYNRTSIKELAESKGWKVTTTVTKNTNLLLADKPSETSKYKKAVELGINIIFKIEEI